MPIDKSIIGTSQYYDLLHQEARYWERSALGEVDSSLAFWRDAELAAIINGSLCERTFNRIAAAGPRVLELGCADGNMGVQLAARGCYVDGVDIAFNLVRQGAAQIHAGAAADPWKKNVHLFVGDLNQLGLAPNTYDAILASSVLHHVLDLDNLTDTLYRALKPGGVLVCLDHMEPTWIGLILRYAFLMLLPTEVPYWRKPLHAFNRLMARLYPKKGPHPIPQAFQLPERSPFEDVTGKEIIPLLFKKFKVETYETHMIFSDTVAGHLRLKSWKSTLALARRLADLDAWLIRHLHLQGETYYLVAQKAKS